MDVLFITPYVPSLIRTRPYNLIRTLVQLGHRVTLLTVSGTSHEEREQIDELCDWGVTVEAFPVPQRRSLRNCLRALPTREPLQAAHAYHPRLEERLGELVNQGSFAVVHIEHLRAARMIRAVRGLPAVFDSVDCISLLFEQAMRRGAQLRSRLMAAIDLARTRRYEAWLLTQYNHVVVTSERDREALERLAHQHLQPKTPIAPIRVLTNGVDLEYFQRQASAEQPIGRAAIFTGKMSYHANVAAALYFAREVLPLIWMRDPEIRFQIVGKDPPESVRRLAADDRIEVTGTVDDIRPYLARASVAVCPALYAVGIQNKVLEAMAMGTPVATTPAACAALSAETGTEIMVANDKQELARAVLAIIWDQSLAKRLAAGGRRYVESHHDWRTIGQQLVTIYKQASSCWTETGGKRPVTQSA